MESVDSPLATHVLSSQTDRQTDRHTDTQHTQQTQHTTHTQHTQHINKQRTTNHYVAQGIRARVRSVPSGVLEFALLLGNAQLGPPSAASPRSSDEAMADILNDADWQWLMNLLGDNPHAKFYPEPNPEPGSPDPKTDAETNANPDPKTNAKIDANPDPKADDKTDDGKTDAKTNANPALKPDTRAEWRALMLAEQWKLYYEMKANPPPRDVLREMALSDKKRRRLRSDFVIAT